MDIKTAKTIAPKLPASIAVLFRGPTGVGKSAITNAIAKELGLPLICLLYTSPSPRDRTRSRMPSSA